MSNAKSKGSSTSSSQTPLPFLFKGLFLILSPPAAGIPDKRDGAQGGRSASASQLKPDHHNCCPEGLRYPCSGGGGEDAAVLIPNLLPGCETPKDNSPGRDGKDEVLQANKEHPTPTAHGSEQVWEPSGSHAGGSLLPYTEAPL